ncbi:putative nicotinamide N-methyase [Litorivivens lipolytica]|uniref:Putative nicotinamide N-methyase n=1 Tax=Litorivivens lipolytica TaxID=1524264 RepID=A0A7W4W5X1_9GAMM|nr:methyltransferase domain-containing protein [Litorivivens lipolytica]MBB3048024.1 putative nicotinamide N-methyase [Litorivivens lipolytica]
MPKPIPNPQIREAYGVIALTSRHPDLRRLKREQATPNIHGNKLWGACYLLMDYLEQAPLPKGCRILDIGCGWGLGGIYCAKTFGAEVTAMDADPAVFPFLQLLAEHNGVEITEQVARFDELRADYLACFDVIIGADICFWDALANDVSDLIDRAVEAGVSRIILTDPQRPPFNALADRCVEEHFAEAFQIETIEPRRFTGTALVIENS